MTPTFDQLDVIFCEGWDPTGHAIVGPIPPEAARGRDERGDEYAVMLFASGAPRALLEVSWKSHACRAWGFDDCRRRTTKHDLRLVDDGQLLLVEEIQWEYSDGMQVEFAPEVPKRISQPQTGKPGGGVLVITEHTRTLMDGPAGGPSLRRPAFGDWDELLFSTRPSALAAGGHETGEEEFDEDLRALLAQLAHSNGSWEAQPLLPNEWAAARLVQHHPVPAGIAVTPYVRPVWQPPHPLEPDPQTLAFSPTVRSTSLNGQRVLLESHIIGALQLPTGHVVAADPHDYFLTDRKSFTVTLPPGNHRFFVNVTRSTEPTGIRPRVAAGGLIISDEQITSWELALLDGEDPRILRDGETYGFGVDSGTACFMDAAAVQTVVNNAAGGENPLQERETGGVRIGFTGDSLSGAGLIAFESGWGDGSYPVWVGRAANRSVVCLVADMLLDARMRSPAALPLATTSVVNRGAGATSATSTPLEGTS
ncbi:DUF4241 domain-containing protein [Streptomyces niveus]|uniref:DUF4241 domain-containing protein n=1 Tax=Streptomyces niveus TaxID=193462 RepID=UPI00343F7376